MRKILLFKPVPVSEIFSCDGFDELVSEYMSESGNPFLPKNPDPDYYRQLEEKGGLSVIGVFSDNRLVGFGSFILTVVPHYSTVTASVESVFLSKPYRWGSNGLKLLDSIRNLAESKGAVGIYWGCRCGSRLEKLFERQSRFTRMNTVFYEAIA